MSGYGSRSSALGGEPAKIDTSVATEARVYDYLLGGGDQLRCRPRDSEVSRFFDGLELLDPGIAPMSEWLPAGTDAQIAQAADIFYYCGIAQKP